MQDQSVSLSIRSPVTDGIERRFGMPLWPPAASPAASLTRPDRPARKPEPRHAAQFLSVLVEERDRVAHDLEVLRAKMRDDLTPHQEHTRPDQSCGISELEADLRYLDQLVAELLAASDPGE